MTTTSLLGPPPHRRPDRDNVSHRHWGSTFGAVQGSGAAGRDPPGSLSRRMAQDRRREPLQRVLTIGGLILILVLYWALPSREPEVAASVDSELSGADPREGSHPPSFARGSAPSTAWDAGLGVASGVTVAADRPPPAEHRHRGAAALGRPQGAEPGEVGPSERLQALLGDPSRVKVGKLKVTGLVQTSPLWMTRYELWTWGGERVALELPGGTDGRLAQQVGHDPLPKDGSEIAYTKDARDRPVWAYHEDGRLSGGSLEDHVIEWK